MPANGDVDIAAVAAVIGHPAEVIEGLALLAPSQPVRSLRDGNRAAAERAARSC